MLEPAERSERNGWSTGIGALEKHERDARIAEVINGSFSGVQSIGNSNHCRNAKQRDDIANQLVAIFRSD